MEQPKLEIDGRGNKGWILPNGNLHRTDGPAVEFADGSKLWYQNGKRHRTNGPAVEWVDGEKSWWVNGKLHRTDGPAVEQADGYKFWCLGGVCYTEEEFETEMLKKKLELFE